jgi:hypothetical protein
MLGALTDSCISNPFLKDALLIALMTVATSTTETPVNFYQVTRRYNPEDGHLHTRLPWEPQTQLKTSNGGFHEMR